MRAALGLLYGTVELRPHTVEWARLFAAEAERLAPVLAAVLAPRCFRVEHVGSTAVPGLAAKPILDIAVGVSAGVAIEPILSALATAGYHYRGDAGQAGGHVLVRESAPLMRTHHLHVVDLGGAAWQAYLTFRDRLRTDADARQAYLEAKHALATRHREDRRAYTAGKSAIITALLVRGNVAARGGSGAPAAET